MNGTIGEIRLFAGNFAPRSWALCQGQLLAISQNTALFSIIGCTYGGDCRTTFSLPDLRGRVAMHAGTGPGLTTRRLGARFGVEDQVITHNQLPAHQHYATFIETSSTGSANLIASNSTDLSNEVDNSFLAQGGSVPEIYSEEAGTAVTHLNGVNVTDVQVAGAVSLNPAGGSHQVNNMGPILTLNYVICLQGVYPSRS